MYENNISEKKYKMRKRDIPVDKSCIFQIFFEPCAEHSIAIAKHSSNSSSINSYCYC